MTDASESASRLANLVAFAGSCSASLYQTLSSFHSQQRRVRSLIEETSALAEVFQSLEATIESNPNLQASALETPLRRCARACQKFESDLEKLPRQSGRGAGNGQDWNSLRYAGEDINGLRHLLSAYRMTIIVAVTDANMSILTTAEAIQGYSNVACAANVSLENRLESIESKLDALRDEGDELTDSQVEDMAQMEEERRSTEICLRICANLSSRIAQIQRRTDGSAAAAAEGSETESEEDLDDCRASLARLAEREARREADLFAKLAERMTGAAASGTTADSIAHIRKEWLFARESMNALALASRRLEQRTNIENFATGDAVQFMVSTKGKTLYGNNRSVGWRARQVGGYVEDETVRELSRNLSGVSFQLKDAKQREVDAAYKDRFGGGYKLTQVGKKRS